MVGHDILVGRALQRTATGTAMRTSFLPVSPMTLAMSAASSRGTNRTYVADISGRKIELPVGSSDAALAPYHVDRSKLFVIERFDAVEDVNAARVARAIDHARFPYADHRKEELRRPRREEGLLLRAADLIGQLGDPNYMRKSDALFHEFEEIGLNKKLGFERPPISFSSLRSSTGPMSLRRSSLRSAISMLRPGVTNGSQTFTAMFLG